MADDAKDTGKSEDTPTDDAKGDDKGEPKDGTDEAKVEDLATVAEILAHKGSDVAAKEAAIEVIRVSDLDRRVNQMQETTAKKNEEVAAKAKQDADDEALAKNQEFEKLAESHAGKIEELGKELEASSESKEAEVARADKAEKVLGAYAKSTIEALGLDESTMALLKGKSSVELMEWLTKYGESLGKKPGGEVPQSPNGDAPEGMTHEERLANSANTW